MRCVFQNVTSLAIQHYTSQGLGNLVKVPLNNPCSTDRNILRQSQGAISSKIGSTPSCCILSHSKYQIFFQRRVLSGRTGGTSEEPRRRHPSPCQTLERCGPSLQSGASQWRRSGSLRRGGGKTSGIQRKHWTFVVLCLKLLVKL